MRRSVIAVVLALAATLAVHAQSKALLAPTGTLRSSFIATNPVQGRVDAKTGAVSGPAEDLTRELARRLGVPYRVTPLPDAGAVLESVKSSRVDIGFLAVEAARRRSISPTPTPVPVPPMPFARTHPFRTPWTSTALV